MRVRTLFVATFLTGLVLGSGFAYVALTYKTTGFAWLSHRHSQLTEHPDAASPSAFDTKYLAAMRMATAGRLQDAQDEFLEILVLAPHDENAMRGLVAVRRRMSGDNAIELRRQAAAYQQTAAHETDTSEHYAPEAMSFLASASVRAAEEVEATHRQAHQVPERRSAGAVGSSRPASQPIAQTGVPTVLHESAASVRPAVKSGPNSTVRTAIGKTASHLRPVPSAPGAGPGSPTPHPVQDGVVSTPPSETAKVSNPSLAPNPQSLPRPSADPSTPSPLSVAVLDGIVTTRTANAALIVTRTTVRPIVITPQTVTYGARNAFGAVAPFDELRAWGTMTAMGTFVANTIDVVSVPTARARGRISTIGPDFLVLNENILLHLTPASVILRRGHPRPIEDLGIGQAVRVAGIWTGLTRLPDDPSRVAASIEARAIEVSDF